MRATTKAQFRLIGQVVTINSVLNRVLLEHGKKVWEPREVEPYTAIITGFGFKANGVADRDPECGPIWTTQKHVPCVFVRRWPTSREVAIPEGGYTRTGVSVEEAIKTGRIKYSSEGRRIDGERQKETMQESPEYFPREKNGRLAKLETCGDLGCGRVIPSNQTLCSYHRNL